MKQRSFLHTITNILGGMLGLILFSGALLFIVYMENDDFRDMVDYKKNHPLTTYTNIDDVAARLQEEILNGTTSFTFYTENITSDDISQINNMIDPTYGTATNQESYPANSKKDGISRQRITLHIQLTPAYYVYSFFLNQQALPEDNAEAYELWLNVSKVLRLLNDDMNDYQKELTIHDYLVENCKYSKNISRSESSNIYSAYGALVEKDAVCDGYAQAMQLLLSCAGVTSKYVSGTATSGSETTNHAWNMVQLNGDWYHLDATWDDPLPDMGELSTHAYFNVTDNYISGSHTWDTTKYPKADSQKFNYYTKSKKRFSSWKKYKDASYKALVKKKEPIYEAYIGKRKVSMSDLMFLRKQTSDHRDYRWNVVNEPKGNVLIVTAQ